MANRTYCMLIDIKRDIFEIIKLKPIDTGNVLHIKFSEDGKPVDLTGQTVKFMAKKPDGTGVYNFANVIDAKAGEIEVEITNQMTAVDGELDCEIEIEGNKLITTMTFYITIDRKLNDGNFIESTNEFTVLQKAINDAYEAIELMETKTDTKLEQLQSQVNTAISDMNETTDTKLNQVQSQVNTAISDMNTKADNKLSQIQSQVNTSIGEMNETTDTKLADLQKQVTTAISGMNSKTDTKLSQVQSQVDTLGAELSDLVDTKITEVNSTQSTLVNKVDSKITELTSTVNSKITEHTNTINAKVTEVNDKIKGYDTKIAEVNTTISNANSTVTALKQDVATAISDIDNKIAGTVDNKADKDHNHDNLYLGKTAKAESSKVADSANAVAWDNITGKPLSFTPASHNHDYLPLSGGTILGSLVVNENINANTLSIGSPTDTLPNSLVGDSITNIRTAGTEGSAGQFHMIRNFGHGSSPKANMQLGWYYGGNNKLKYRIQNANNGLWGNWGTIYSDINKPTPADIGASASNHNHDGVYMSQANANGYWGITANGNQSDWVRTTVSGIIPYQSGGASSVGTSSWPFHDIYANNIYDNGTLLENKFASLGGDVSFHIVRTTSNGQGNNIAIGDDCWLGDVNEYATAKIQCQDGSGTGYIRFGNGAKIGYGGGAPLDIHGGAWVVGEVHADTGFTIANFGDLCDGSPWYGLGKTWLNMGGGGGSASGIQVAGYYGLRLRSDDSVLDIYHARRSMGTNANLGFYSDTFVPGAELYRGAGHVRLAPANTVGDLRLELLSNDTYIAGEYVLASSTFYPVRNSPMLGHSSYRWGQIYSTSGSISTSDSKLKENIKPISRSADTALLNSGEPTGTDFYNYVKGTSTYTFNYKREFNADTQNWLGVLADEIPDNIFDKIGMVSKTEEEYRKELEEQEKAKLLLSEIDAKMALRSKDSELEDSELEDTELKDEDIVEGTELTYRELKFKATEVIEEPVRMINSSAQIAMLQEVLAISLRKIEELENRLESIEEKM